MEEVIRVTVLLPNDVDANRMTVRRGNILNDTIIFQLQAWFDEKKHVRVSF